MKALLQNLRDLRAFSRLPRSRRGIVFYSEGRWNWPHLEPLLRALVDGHGHAACYVASAADDPGLLLKHPRIAAFRVGEGAARTIFFRVLDCDVMVMTMPDLHSSYIKRSARPVHYVYVHHSMVSTHMIYRAAAFDHFDTIFCVGPHHVAETREAERLRALPPKQLFEHGCSHLDHLMKEWTTQRAARPDPSNILIAPSWGPSGLLETCGAALVGVLLDAGYTVTVRPHPETSRRAPGVLHALRQQFGGWPAFQLDADIVSNASYERAALMISDWSGAALEYAFALERPVLYVDVPRKVRNPEYVRLSAVPLEVSIRERIGAVLPTAELGSAPAAVADLLSQFGQRAAAIRAARDRCVFNVGHSAERGARELIALATARSSTEAGSGGDRHAR